MGTMCKANEYWANAAECQRMADLALSEKDKGQWLKIAESWLRMAVGLEWSRVAAFGAEHAARGTGQEESTSSH